MRIVAAARRVAVMLASAVIIGAASASAQPRDTTVEARPLLPMARAFLNEALAREDEAKRRGWRRVAGFPVAFPLPMCQFEGGLCGAVNRDGSIAVAPRFDFVDDFHEGRAVVRLGGLYGYVDIQGRLVVQPQHAIAGRYRGGLAEVDVDGKSALIDLDGREVLAPRFASALPFTKSVFWVNDGVRVADRLRPGREEFPGADAPPGGMPLRVDAKWGLIDVSGTWIRQPEFRDIAAFDPENENLMWAQADTGWGLIRPDGTWALEPAFQYKLALSDDRAEVWRGGKTGYIDRTGQMVIPPKFEIVIGSRGFVGGMPAPAKLGGLVGLIDQSGKWVLEPAYDRIYPHNGGLAFNAFEARRGGRTDILDATGKVLISGMKLRPGTSTSCDSPSGGMCISMTPGQFTQFCADGRIIGFMDEMPRLFDRDGTQLDPAKGEMWWPLTCEPPYVVKIGGDSPTSIAGCGH
jgi:hypothetical protein